MVEDFILPSSAVYQRIQK